MKIVVMFAIMGMVGTAVSGQDKGAAAPTGGLKARTYNSGFALAHDTYNATEMFIMC
jgi:hypothetical protein